MVCWKPATNSGTSVQWTALCGVLRSNGFHFVVDSFKSHTQILVKSNMSPSVSRRAKMLYATSKKDFDKSHASSK